MVIWKVTPGGISPSAISPRRLPPLVPLQTSQTCSVLPSGRVKVASQPTRSGPEYSVVPAALVTVPVCRLASRLLPADPDRVESSSVTVKVIASVGALKVERMRKVAPTAGAPLTGT